MIGSTADVAGELVALADVPDGILSPAGSSIPKFAVSYYGLDEYFVATATFSSDATAEDAVVFYQATLAAAVSLPSPTASSRESRPCATFASTTRPPRWRTPASTSASSTVPTRRSS